MKQDTLMFRIFWDVLVLVSQNACGGGDGRDKSNWMVVSAGNINKAEEGTGSARRQGASYTRYWGGGWGLPL